MKRSRCRDSNVGGAVPTDTSHALPSCLVAPGQSEAFILETQHRQCLGAYPSANSSTMRRKTGIDTVTVAAEATKAMAMALNEKAVGSLPAKAAVPNP